MDVGPYACGLCLIMLRQETRPHRLKCPICNAAGDDKSFYVWEFDSKDYAYIMKNTKLHNGHVIYPNPLVGLAYTTRPWPKNSDPNELWRPWLEEHVGSQNIDWDWILWPNRIDIVEISFVDPLNATLFELKW